MGGVTDATNIFFTVDGYNVKKHSVNTQLTAPITALVIFHQFHVGSCHTGRKKIMCEN